MASPNKTYKKPHTWDAYLNVFAKDSSGRIGGRVLSKKRMKVKAVSRIDAFNKLRTEAVRLNRKSKTRYYDRGGVAMRPTDYAGR